MKSLSELAAIYEKWATANQITAEELLACVDTLPKDVQEQQRWRAGQLAADAAALKIRAKELRELDGGMMVEIVQDGDKDPQDRNPGCDGPQATWRSKHSR